MGILLYLLPRTDDSLVYWSIRSAASVLLIAWYLVMAFAWGKAVAQLGTKAGTIVPVATFLVGIGVTLFYYLPAPLSEIMQVVTPLMSGIFWWLSPPAEDRELSFSWEGLQNAPFQTLVVCAIFYCAAGTMRDFVSYNNYEAIGDFSSSVPLMVSLFTAGILLISLLMSSRTKGANHSFTIAWAVASIVFFACIILVASGVTPQHKGGDSLLSSSYMCFKLLLWLFASIVARNSKASVVLVFTVFFIAPAALMLCGAVLIAPVMLQTTSFALYPYESQVLLFSVVILMAIAMVFLLRYAPLATGAIVDSEKSTSRFTAIQELATKHGLTSREAEVALLISQGYSAKRVAEMLYISQETVRTHTKKIYKKLDLHTKQELIELINSSQLSVSCDLWTPKQESDES
ncbi:MAG: helix-turn-helix transcriptional regulator [Raoultibacter sp.]